MTRCHAFSCDDPLGGPEPDASLDGMPAHPDCAAYEEDARTERLLGAGG